MFDMTECGRAEGEYWTPDLSIRDDLDTEDVSQTRTAVIAKRAEYEVFALLVEDQYS